MTIESRPTARTTRIRGAVLLALLAAATALAGCNGTGPPDGSALPMDVFASARDSPMAHTFTLEVWQGEDAIYRGEHTVPAGGFRSIAHVDSVAGEATVRALTGERDHDWRVLTRTCAGTGGLLVTLFFEPDGVELQTTCNEGLEPQT